ncbi:MAG TPA: hypothetical protein VJH87_07100, partial [Vicinamibacteria bacterium]|nr:hypothetical protein [Vicinamibacteria bacterium]
MPTNQDDRSFVFEQIRERLLFYGSLTSLGFSRETEVEAPKQKPAPATPARNETLDEVRAD